MIAKLRSRLPSKALFAAAFIACPAYAQAGNVADSTTATQTASEICSTIPPVDYAQAKPYLELVLIPGQKVDISKIAPEDMAKMMDLQKASTERQAMDWANLCRYAGDNAKLATDEKPVRTIFLGDSITEYWQQADPSLFSEAVLDRGISGQTTAQILLRFYPDVVALKPRVVHIMAGTNDIAGNLGQVSDETIIANIAAMLDIAKANNIGVVLASIPPARFMGWKPGLTPAPRIAALNQRLQMLAKARGAAYLDYHSRLKDDQGGFQTALANDGVHPNRDAYAIMRPMAEQAIRQAAVQKK